MGDIIVKINPTVSKTVVIESPTTKAVNVGIGCAGSSVDLSAYVKHIETGSFSGQFYPYNLNPSGYLTAVNATTVEFQTTLPDSIDYYDVNYPFVLSAPPASVVCGLENNVDEFIYSHAINSVNVTGFRIFFSDILTSSGYILHTTVGR
jgi:hypothetical protein